MFTSQIFFMIRCFILSTLHPQPPIVQWCSGCTRLFKPPSMSSHYQILSVLYFRLLSNPCFFFSAPVLPLCLRNPSVWNGKLTNPYFFKFLQPYFLTLKTPSNHSEYKYSHFTGARQYIPESRDELLFWYDPIQNFRIAPAFSVLFTPSLHSQKVSL